MALRKPSWGSQQSLDPSEINSPERRHMKELDATFSLYVTNLPQKTNFFTFAGHFASFPSLVGVRLLPFKSHFDGTRAGFVNFESVVDAENAIWEFDKKPPHNLHVRFCRRDMERNANKNCENHDYSYDDGEDLAGINLGRMAVNIAPGYEGRRIVVNNNAANRFSDRPEFCAWQKNSEVSEGRGGWQNRQYIDINAGGDGFNRRDSLRASERTKRFDSVHQQSNGNSQHEPKFNRSGSQRQRNFSNSVEEEDRHREMMARSKQKSDFNKNRQRAKSCERMSSNRSEHSVGNARLHNEDIGEDELERYSPSFKNRVNFNRKSPSINDNRVSRNSRVETQDTASELSSENYSFQVEQIELEMGKTTRCTVTHMESNGVFWAQSDPSFADKLETSLAEDAKRSSVGKCLKPKVGGIYLVQFEHDSMWYRGKILKVNEHTVDVHFIDYGNSSLNVSLNKVKGLSPDKRKYPAQAIKFKPSSSTVKKYPNPEAFYEAIGGSECDLLVESIHNDYYVVTVDVCSGGPIPKSTELAKRSPMTDSTAAKRVKEAPKESLSDMMLKLKNSKPKNEIPKREFGGDKYRLSESNERSTPSPLMKHEEADRNERPFVGLESSGEQPTEAMKMKMNSEPEFSGEQPTRAMKMKMNSESEFSGEQPTRAMKMKMNSESEFSGEQPTKSMKMKMNSEPEFSGEQPTRAMKMKMNSEPESSGEQPIKASKMNSEPESSGEQPTRASKMNSEPESSGEQPTKATKMNSEPESSGEQPTKAMKMTREQKLQLGAMKLKVVDNSTKENVKPHFCNFILSQLNVGDKFALFPMVPDSPVSLWGTIDSADSLQKLLGTGGFDMTYEALDENLSSAPVGSLIVAKSEAYENWGRVVVLANDTDKPEVFFVDYGNKENVTAKKPILDQHKDLPGLAAYCEIDTATLTQDEKKALTECLGGAAAMLMVVTEKLGNDRIKTALLDHKMAPCVLRSGQFVIDDKLNKSEKPLLTVENLPRFEKGLRTTTMLVEIGSTRRIHVCPATVYDDISKLEAEPPLTGIREKYAARVKELVLAKYSATQQMYRAEVTQVGTDRASVLFIDYGNQEDVSLNEICAIPEELLKIPLCIVAVKDNPQSVMRLKEFAHDTLTMCVVDSDCLPAVVEFYKNNINVLSEG